MLRLRTAALAGAIALPLAVGGFLIGERHAGDSARLFDEVLRIVGDRYVDTLAVGALYEKSARGLVRELNDPYSELFSPKQLARFSTQSTGKYGGIGMQIEQQEGGIVVVRVFPHTPAEAAGIVEGDRIIGIDTTSTRGWTSQRVSDVLIGKIGTTVRVRFARPGLPQPIEHAFTRAEIRIPAVPYALMLDDHIAYIPLQQFNETASDELRAAVTRLQNAGATRIILDLRGDPGGILDQALSVGSLFLADGQFLLSVRTREGPPQVYNSRGSQHITGVPLVALVDGYSASASEIVAGALQDQDRALLVGTRSYGKGLVQSVYRLDDGWALKLTTGKWYTPSGRSIQKDHWKLPADDGGDADTVPDSAARDTSEKARPIAHSESGRILIGGGGITPDIIVKADTLSTAEQEFSKLLAPKFPAVRAALYEIALEQKGHVAPGFTVPEAWRTRFYQRLVQDSIKVDRKQFDQATPLVDRMLAAQVARVAFGDSAAFRRSIPEDAQLRRAIELLNRSRTQQQLFTLAKASPAGTH
jgi:carboxyl-terminal processing protease